jgi:sigma-E factor negative regulatory protein RseB
VINPRKKWLCLTRRLLAAALLVALSQTATAAGDAECGDTETNQEALKWLAKMSHSASEVSYQGVVTFQRGEDMQVMQVSHLVSDGAASEHLTQLTGQGAQVTRVEHPLECVHPGQKLLRLNEGLKAGNCGIAQNYRFKVTEGERIAGRKAVRIYIVAKDMYRHGYIMELDKKTGLLLKTQTIGLGDKVLERFQFANLSFRNPLTPASQDADIVHRATHPRPGDQADSAQDFEGNWSARWVPRGFTATDDSSGGNKRRSYTDGLAVFSVFLEILPRDIQPGEGVVRQGGTTSYTRGLVLGDSPVLVTVIGEIPLNTARMVADSIAWQR